MIAEIRFDASGPPLLVRHDGWQYPLAGIYGIEMRFGDHAWRSDYYVARAVVTIPALTVNNVADVTRSLQVLREELPQDCELVVETNY